MDEKLTEEVTEATETSNSQAIAPPDSSDSTPVEECIDVAAVDPLMAATADTSAEDIELPAAKSMFRDNMAAFGFSQQGRSHIADNIPCQDRCDVRFLSSRPIVVCAIADGVSNCELSHYGSDVAVRAAVDTVITELEPLAEAPDFVFLDNQRMKGILVKAFETAVDSVEEKAQEMGRLPFSYQSTLTVAIYDGKSLYFGHAGDDGIVALCKDGTCQMVTTRHKGEEASSVVTLQAHRWQFGLIDREVACFVAMTDGVLDAVVGNQLFDNRIYYPFFDSIFRSEFTDLKSVEETCGSMFNILSSDGYRERVHDDLTLVAVVNADMLKTTQKPVFDRDAWKKKDEEVKKKADSILYANQSTAQQTTPTMSSNQSRVPPKAPQQPVPDQPIGQSTPQRNYTSPTNQPPKKSVYGSSVNHAPPSHAVSKSVQPAQGDTERLLNQVRSSLQNTGYPDKSKLSPELTADLNELKRLVKKSSKQFFAIAHTSALEVSNQVIQHIDRFIVEYINSDDQPDN